MVVIGERLVAGGNGSNPQTEKSRYALASEAFWRCDKFLIRAVIFNLCFCPTCPAMSMRVKFFRILPMKLLFYAALLSRQKRLWPVWRRNPFASLDGGKKGP